MPAWPLSRPCPPDRCERAVCLCPCAPTSLRRLYMGNFSQFRTVDYRISASEREPMQLLGSLAPFRTLEVDEPFSLPSTLHKSPGEREQMENRAAVLCRSPLPTSPALSRLRRRWREDCQQDHTAWPGSRSLSVSVTQSQQFDKDHAAHLCFQDPGVSCACSRQGSGRKNGLHLGSRQSALLVDVLYRSSEFVSWFLGHATRVWTRGADGL
ncbi:hypothetical protein LX36DRAFT_137747 [Colletotrichum falcatum]|nr:hypothetical protein LX36DRAFT_137747 [Colletotrichum falcatum]